MLEVLDSILHFIFNAVTGALGGLIILVVITWLGVLFNRLVIKFL